MASIFVIFLKYTVSKIDPNTGHPQGFCHVNKLKMGFKWCNNIELSSWIAEKSKCNSVQLMKIILFLFKLFTSYTSVTENNPSVGCLWIQVQIKWFPFF